MADAENRSLRKARVVPYALSFPGMLWMFLFFVVPLVTLLRIALSYKPDPFHPQTVFNWQWSNFGTAFSKYGGPLVRGFVYAGIATLLCVLISYPIAYFIAFRAGAWKNLLLGLVMVPFFTSFLLRTIAWKTLLADHGVVLGALRNLHLTGLLGHLGVLESGRLLNTDSAVIGGLTYNFLPFALLPIYVSLEKIDLRLMDAAADLYSPFARSFRKVILPLSLPGVFAGTLLTFIPATGDFINVTLLGNPTTAVIGNKVQQEFLVNSNYPTAAAISLVLMLIISTMVLVYAKFLGTEDLA